MDCCFHADYLQTIIKEIMVYEDSDLVVYVVFSVTEMHTKNCLCATNKNIQHTTYKETVNI